MTYWEEKSFVTSKAVNVAFDIVYFEMASLHPASKIRKLYKSIEITPRVLILVVFFFTWNVAKQIGRYCYGGTIYNIFISKGFEKNKQVKISDMKEQCLGDIMTPFPSSNAKR